MYNENMLIGILLSISKMKLILQKREESSIGYEVRLNLVIRGQEEFLKGIQRDLLMYYNIETNLRLKESKTRPRPILVIGKIKQLQRLVELVPNLPSANGEWPTFKECVEIVADKKHLRLEGLERIMQIKGVL